MLAENWKDFLKPSKISYDASNNDKTAKIVIEPLERGFGTTVGNVLRRTLLSSIYGTAITAFTVEGIIHEQDAIEGLSEDMIDVIFNLKQVVLTAETDKTKKASIDITGPAVVTAGMIKLPEGISLINPEQVICNLEDKAKFQAEFVIESGKGYKKSSEANNDNAKIGMIYIDAILSPVTKVAFQVINTRVGEAVDYDKLILEVETNGSIKPDLAIGIAAKIMKEQINLFINFDETVAITSKTEEEDQKLSFNPVLLKKVDELELSVRSQNCLQNEKIDYLGDLVMKSENDMLKTPNFGRKSLNEIKAILQSLNLNFGMNIEEWPPQNVEELAKNFEEAN